MIVETNLPRGGVCCVGGVNLKMGDKRIVYACGITDNFLKMNIILTTAEHKGTFSFASSLFLENCKGGRGRVQGVKIDKVVLS